jgi:hypothetical protein
VQRPGSNTFSCRGLLRDLNLPTVILVSQHHANRYGMSQTDAQYFDLQTVALLREALDDAWASLSPKQRESSTRSLFAERILKVAASGERDRERLIEAALAPALAA